MPNKLEIQIVIDNEGVKCVRIVGSSEEHKTGHSLYIQLLDLIENFDKEIQKRLNEGKTEHGASEFNA